MNIIEDARKRIWAEAVAGGADGRSDRRRQHHPIHRSLQKGSDRRTFSDVVLRDLDETADIPSKSGGEKRRGHPPHRRAGTS